VYHLYSYIILYGNYAVFWKGRRKRAYIGSGNADEDAESAEPTYEDLDFKEGLTDRELRLIQFN
jgi:hypothetical protein